MNSRVRPLASPDALVDRLIEMYPKLSHALRAPAKFLIDNQAEIGVNSMRQIARMVDCSPNALMRLAKAIGCSGFAEFQAPFREALRNNSTSIPDRARWLQALGRGGSDQVLLSQMAAANLNNIEHLFSGLEASHLHSAAKAIIEARMTYVVGVRGAYSLAHNFYYVAKMALGNLTLVPRQASSVIDDIITVGPSDVVVAISLAPYAVDTVDAVHYATAQGATVVAVTDSRASPLARAGAHVFLAPSGTPQFFNSIVASAAMLETLLAFIVARGDEPMLASIRRHDRIRHEHGSYWHDSKAR